MKSRFILIGAGAVAAILIATISFYYATKQTGTCGSGDGAMAAFEPTTDAPPAPDVAFVDGDGRERTLADFRGDGVIVNFWATWCPPCVREMPALDRLQGLLAESGIRVLALSGDRDGAAVVEAFYAENGIERLPVAVEPGLRAARAFKVKGLPTTVLIDAGGRERGRLSGAAEWDSEDAVALVRDCLDGRSR